MGIGANIPIRARRRALLVAALLVGVSCSRMTGPNEDSSDGGDTETTDTESASGSDSDSDSNSDPEDCAVVGFDDPNLEALISEELSIEAGEISGEDLADLELLKLIEDRGIASLSGLQCATGLTSLWLTGNRIAGLDPIAKLPALARLVVSGNAISSLEPVRDLKTLESLMVGDNPIDDLSPISQLQSLRLLSIPDTSVTSLEPVEGVPLTLLGAENCPLESIGVLEENTTMEVIYLHNTGIADLTPLRQMINLRYVGANDNFITDLSPIENAVGLETVSLDNNSVDDLAPLARIETLRKLYLRNNEILDLSPLLDAAWEQRFLLCVEENPLSAESLEEILPELCNRDWVIYWSARTEELESCGEVMEP